MPIIKAEITNEQSDGKKIRYKLKGEQFTYMMKECKGWGQFWDYLNANAEKEEIEEG